MYLSATILTKTLNQTTIGSLCTYRKWHACRRATALGQVWWKTETRWCLDRNWPWIGCRHLEIQEIVSKFRYLQHGAFDKNGYTVLNRVDYLADIHSQTCVFEIIVYFVVERFAVNRCSPSAGSCWIATWEYFYHLKRKLQLHLNSTYPCA